MAQKNNVLSLLASGKIELGANLTAFARTLNEQLALIRSANPLIAKRAIYIGTSLLMVKESLEHGQFGPWLEKHIEDIGRRQVAYYMKLALAALDHEQIDEAALRALPVGDIEAALTITKGPGVKLREAVDSFVGDSSLAELLEEHCGKKAGKKKMKVAESAEPTTAAKLERTAQDNFNEVAEHLRLARQGATDKAVWMNMSQKQHADLKAMFADAHDRIVDLFVKTHGRAKK